MQKIHSERLAHAAHVRVHKIRYTLNVVSRLCTRTGPLLSRICGMANQTTCHKVKVSVSRIHFAVITRPTFKTVDDELLHSICN